MKPGCWPLAKLPNIIPVVNHPDDKPVNVIDQLIAEINQGRNVEENFRHIVERHYARTCRYFQRQGEKLEDATELTQITFISVYKGLKEFRSEATFNTWLFSIAKNVLKDEQEKRRAHKRKGIVLSIDQSSHEDSEGSLPLAAQIKDLSPNPLEVALRKEKLLKLREAMQQLPEKMRRCTELRVIGELSHQQIAELTGSEVNTVKAHLHQAKKKLSERLGPYFGSIDF